MAKSVYVGVDSKKITLVNLAPTINGTTGWTRSSSGGSISASSSITKYSSSSLCISGTTSTGEVCATSTATITVVPDHFYYISYWYYTDTSSTRTTAYWPIAEPPFGVETVSQTNTWVKYVDIEKKHSANFNAGNYSMRLDFDNLNKAGKMYFDGLVLIDLTECFGSGNEPDEDWCNTNIPYFTGNITIEQKTEKGIARRVKRIYIGVNGIARRVIRGYCGVGGVARLFYSDDSVDDGTYWLLLKDGWTEYDANGNAVNSGAYGTWPCPSSGTYTVEIHGGGGGAAGSLVPENDDPICKGGNGGGSGAIYTLKLSAKTYSYSIGEAGRNSRNGMVDSANTNWGTEDGDPGYASTFDIYTVNGGEGGDGADLYWGEYYHGIPGAAGEATAGYIEIIGEAGGSGNSSIGNYGDGGTTGYSGDDPTDGGIIIRKYNAGSIGSSILKTAVTITDKWIAPHTFAVANSYIIVCSGYKSGGNYQNSTSSLTNAKTAYDKSGTAHSVSMTIDSVRKYKGMGESVGNYGIHAYKSSSTTLRAVNTSLTSTSITSKGTAKVASRVPDYMIYFAKTSDTAISANLTVTSPFNSGTNNNIHGYGATRVSNKYAICIKDYNTFTYCNNSLTLGTFDWASTFSSNCHIGNYYGAPHINGAIYMDSGNDTDDGEEYSGTHVVFINESLTVTSLANKDSYSEPAARMKLGGKTLFFGHGQIDNVDTWCRCYDESLTLTWQNSYITASNCGAASSLSENWGIVVGGLAYMDGTDVYGSTNMNILESF